MNNQFNFIVPLIRSGSPLLTRSESPFRDNDYQLDYLELNFRPKTPPYPPLPPFELKTYSIPGDGTDITYIPINLIRFSDRMHEFLYDRGIYISKKYTSSEEKLDSERYTRVIEGIKSGDTLPPVNLTIKKDIVKRNSMQAPPFKKRSSMSEQEIKYFEDFKKYNKIIEDTEITYSIDNGRHRVAAAYALGLTHIPAIIS